MSVVRAPARRARLVALGLVALLLYGLLVGPLGVPAAAAETPSVLVVLDASGSMKRTDASGSTLMEGAKAAVGRVVDSLPAGTRVGVRAYGHTYPGEDKAAGCKDSALLAPVAPNNPAGIKAAIAGLRPTGFTPIGHALALAARDLPADGPRTIVLVSDGEDTCTPPDPCEVARNLRAQGVAVKVETVGLLLEGPKARGQLQCIARATGGSYRDVSSVADLASSLVDISSRAARGVTTGQRVEGTPSKADAPMLTRGLYSDSILVPEILHYAFEAPAGSRIVVRVTSAGVPRLASIRRSLYLYVEPENGCCRSFDIPFAEAGNLPIDATAVVKQVTANTAGRWYVSLKSEPGNSKPSGTPPAASEFPVQLQIEITGGAGASPTPSESATASPAASPSPSTSTGAGSGAAATPATDGGSDIPGWLLAVVGALAVGLLALGAVVVVLFSRLRSAAPPGGSPPAPPA